MWDVSAGVAKAEFSEGTKPIQGERQNLTMDRHHLFQKMYVVHVLIFIIKNLQFHEWPWPDFEFWHFQTWSGWPIRMPPTTFWWLFILRILWFSGTPTREPNSGRSPTRSLFSRSRLILSTPKMLHVRPCKAKQILMFWFSGNTTPDRMLTHWLIFYNALP